MDFVVSSFVFAILSFAILYFFLNKYAFGPLFAMMEKRREMVKEQMDSAEQNRQQSEKLLAEQKESIQQTKKEAYDIIEQARKAGSKQAEDILGAAKEEAERLKGNALQDIESEKNKAIAELRSQVTGMSVLIASKIIEKQVDEASQKELVDQYLQEVGKKS